MCLFLKLSAIHRCPYHIQFPRANIKVAFLPEHKYWGFEKSFFLPGRQRGLFPAASFSSLLPLQPFHYAEKFHYQTFNYRVYLRANLKAKWGLVLCTVQLNTTRAVFPPTSGQGSFGRSGEGRPIPSLHGWLCGGFGVCPLQEELLSPTELPLTHALIQSVVSLFNLFIRLFSNLGCGNYSVNYSQHNKILIKHSYFRLLRYMSIQPQNQGHVQ